MLMFLSKLLYPPKWLVFLLSAVVFTILIFIFIESQNNSMLSYVIYFMSAYSLTILILALPSPIKKLKYSVLNFRLFKNLSGYKIAGKYLNDISFRGSISIYQGVAVNFLTGSFIYGIVIFIAVYMLYYSRKLLRR